MPDEQNLDELPVFDLQAKLAATEGKPDWTLDDQPTPDVAADRVKDFFSTHAVAGSDWGTAAKQFKQKFPNVDPEAFKDDYQQFGHDARLEQARRVTQTPEYTASLEGSNTLRHAVSYGRPIYETYKYSQAVKRYESGTPEPDDYGTIAMYERERQYDAEREKTTGGFLANRAIELPGQIAALTVGAGLGGAAAGAMGVGNLAGMGLAGRAAGAVGTAALAGIATPTLYAERAIQSNAEEGRDLFDPRGMARPVALATAQMLTLGALGKVSGLIKPDAGALGQAMIQGATGPIAQAVTDLVTSAVGLDTGYGTVGMMLRGDMGEAAKHMAGQVMMFAGFGAMHAHAPEPEAAKSSPKMLGAYARPMPGEGPTPRETPQLDGRRLDTPQLTEGTRSRPATVGEFGRDFPPDAGSPPMSRDQFVKAFEPTPRATVDKDAPDRVMQNFATAWGDMQRQGYSPDQIAAAFKPTQEWVEKAKTDPSLTREVARRIAAKEPAGPMRAFAESMADMIPQEKPSRALEGHTEYELDPSGQGFRTKRPVSIRAERAADRSNRPATIFDQVYGGPGPEVAPKAPIPAPEPMAPPPNGGLGAAKAPPERPIVDPGASGEVSGPVYDFLNGSSQGDLIKFGKDFGVPGLRNDMSKDAAIKAIRARMGDDTLRNFIPADQLQAQREAAKTAGVNNLTPEPAAESTVGGPQLPAEPEETPVQYRARLEQNLAKKGYDPQSVRDAVESAAEQEVSWDQYKELTNIPWDKFDTRDRYAREIFDDVKAQVAADADKEGAFDQAEYERIKAEKIARGEKQVEPAPTPDTVKKRLEYNQRRRLARAEKAEAMADAQAKRLEGVKDDAVRSGFAPAAVAESVRRGEESADADIARGAAAEPQGSGAGQEAGVGKEVPRDPAARYKQLYDSVADSGANPAVVEQTVRQITADMKRDEIIALAKANGIKKNYKTKAEWVEALEGRVMDWGELWSKVHNGEFDSIEQAQAAGPDELGPKATKIDMARFNAPNASEFEKQEVLMRSYGAKTLYGEIMAGGGISEKSVYAMLGKADGDALMRESGLPRALFNKKGGQSLDELGEHYLGRGGDHYGERAIAQPDESMHQWEQVLDLLKDHHVLDEGGWGEYQHARRQAAESTPQEPPDDVGDFNPASFMRSVGAELRDKVESGSGLSDAKRKEYSDTFRDVIAGMSPEARRAALRNIKSVEFHADTQGVTDSFIQTVRADKSLSAADRVEWETLFQNAKRKGHTFGGGYYKGKVMVDGDYDAGEGAHRGDYASPGVIPARQIYAHELGHAVDGDGFGLSGSREWKRVFDSEIARPTPDGKARLSNYASTHPSEAFAEVMRVLKGTDAPTAQFARDFPMATDFFKALNLWPAERVGVEAPVEEIFHDRLGAEDSPDHVDVLKPSEAGSGLMRSEGDRRSAFAKVLDAAGYLRGDVVRAFEAIGLGKTKATFNDAIEDVVARMKDDPEGYAKRIGETQSFGRPLTDGQMNNARSLVRQLVTAYETGRVRKGMTLEQQLDSLDHFDAGGDNETRPRGGDQGGDGGGVGLGFMRGRDLSEREEAALKGRAAGKTLDEIAADPIFAKADGTAPGRAYINNVLRAARDKAGVERAKAVPVSDAEAGAAGLTPRQSHVVNEYAAGRSMRDIAGDDIFQKKDGGTPDQRTVRETLQFAYEKLGRSLVKESSRDADAAAVGGKPEPTFGTLDDYAKHYRLSPRETELMTSLARGRTLDEVVAGFAKADGEPVSDSYVANLESRVKRKLGITGPLRDALEASDAMAREDAMRERSRLTRPEDFQTDAPALRRRADASERAFRSLDELADHMMEEADNAGPEGLSQDRLDYYRAEGARLDSVARGRTPTARGETPGRQPVGTGFVRRVDEDGLKATALKDATMERERAARGLPPILREVYRGDDQVRADALSFMSHGPEVVDALIAELHNKPRPTTDTEGVVILHRKVQVMNEYDKAILATAEARKAKDPQKIADAEANEAAWNKALNYIDEVDEWVGSQAGRGFRARQIIMREDFSLGRMLAEAVRAKGRDLTPEEHEGVVKDANTIKTGQDTIDAATKGNGGTGTADGGTGGTVGGPQLPPDKLQDIQFAVKEAKKSQRNRVQGFKNANQTPGQKAWRWGTESVNLARSLVLGMDLPPMLRQGLITTLSHPKLSLKAWYDSLPAIRSERDAFRLEKELEDRPNYKSLKYRIAGLDFTGTEGPLSHHEESFASRLFGKIPLLKALERSHVTYLNRLRADLFDAMEASFGEKGKFTDAEAADAARYVNYSTGRGGLGAWQKHADGLSQVFLAPKWAVSRFQYLGGVAAFKASTPAGRKAIAAEYARFAVGLGVMYSMAALAGLQTESDPRSTDFGKFRLGQGTRLDPLGGLSQPTVFMSKLAAGESKNVNTGNVSAIRGDRKSKDNPAGVPYGGSDGADVIARFLRAKLAPLPGAAIDVAAGKDLTGQKVDVPIAAKNLVTPLIAKDIQEILTDDYGLTTKAAASALAMVGAGVQVHSPPTTPAARPGGGLGAATPRSRRPSRPLPPLPPGRPTPSAP